MRFTEARLGRVFVLRLHDADRLPDVIESFAVNHHISSALCLFIGGARGRSRVVVGPKNGDALPIVPMTTLLRGVHESLGAGTIFVNEEEQPKLHMHAAFGRNDSTITGCVRMGVNVWQIGEVTLLEMTGASARRAKDKKTGLEFLEIE